MGRRRRKRAPSRIEQWAEEQAAAIREGQREREKRRQEELRALERPRLVSYYVSHFGALFWRWYHDNGKSLDEAIRIASSALAWRKMESTEDRVKRHKSGTGKRR